MPKSCAACVFRAGVARFMGIFYSEIESVKRVKTGPNGTIEKDLVEALQAEGLVVKPTWCSPRRVTNELKAGRWVIMADFRTYKALHAIVVVGCNSNKFFILDPAVGPRLLEKQVIARRCYSRGISIYR